MPDIQAFSISRVFNAARELVFKVHTEPAHLGAKTKLTHTWLPIHADDAGNAMFDGARGGMEQGWGGHFAKLEAYLSTLQA